MRLTSPLLLLALALSAAAQQNNPNNNNPNDNDPTPSPTPRPPPPPRPSSTFVVATPSPSPAGPDKPNGPAPGIESDDNGNPIPEGAPVNSDEAGAAGDDTGAFAVGKGGLAAIISVVVVFAVIGSASLTLWYLAKKRQWQVRASLRRASRRLTGRATKADADAAAAARARRQSKRAGVRMASPTRRAGEAKPKDLEKGEAGRREKREGVRAEAFEVEGGKGGKAGGLRGLFAGGKK